MRLRHRGKRPVRREDVAPPQPGFTPYQCVSIYWLNEHGVSERAIAQQLDCAKTTIHCAVQRGRDTFHQWDVPRLTVLTGNSSGTQCSHGNPIRVGDKEVCCVCFVSGYDDVFAMQVTASDLATIEREAFEATLSKDSQGQPIYPQDPLKPFAQRKFGGRKEKQ